MIIMKIPQNFIKSHLKFWLISQISAHMLKKIKFDTFFLLPTFSGKQNQGCGNSKILYVLALGQVNGHNVLLQWKFYLPKRTENAQRTQTLKK